MYLRRAEVDVAALMGFVNGLTSGTAMESWINSGSKYWRSAYFMCPCAGGL